MPLYKINTLLCSNQEPFSWWWPSVLQQLCILVGFTCRVQASFFLIHLFYWKKKILFSYPSLSVERKRKMNRPLNVELQLLHLENVLENLLYKKLLMLMYILSFPLLDVFIVCLNTELVDMLYKSINTFNGDRDLFFYPKSHSTVLTSKNK